MILVLPFLEFGSISSAIYLTDDDYLMFSSWVVTTDPFGNGSLSYSRKIDHHLALSEYCVNRDALLRFVGPFVEKNQTFLQVQSFPRRHFVCIVSIRR